MILNVASWDRVVRIIAGLGLLSLAFVGPKTPYGYVGLLLIGTGFVGYCPAYSLFGRGTRAMPKDNTANS